MPAIEVLEVVVMLPQIEVAVFQVQTLRLAWTLPQFFVSPLVGSLVIMSAIEVVVVMLVARDGAASEVILPPIEVLVSLVTMPAIEVLEVVVMLP